MPTTASSMMVNTISSTRKERRFRLGLGCHDGLLPHCGASYDKDRSEFRGQQCSTGNSMTHPAAPSCRFAHPLDLLHIAPGLTVALAPKPERCAMLQMVSR